MRSTGAYFGLWTLATKLNLALAAGIALLLSLFVTLARPAELRADAAIARHRHAVDGFRASPFAADDIAAGLRARLADAEFGARPGGRR